MSDRDRKHGRLASGGHVGRMPPLPDDCYPLGSTPLPPLEPPPMPPLMMRIDPNSFGTWLGMSLGGHVRKSRPRLRPIGQALAWLAKPVQRVELAAGALRHGAIDYTHEPVSDRLVAWSQRLDPRPYRHRLTDPAAQARWGLAYLRRRYRQGSGFDWGGGRR